MSESFEIQAELRHDLGKGASRRLRRNENKMPAVIYGGGQEAESVTLILKDFVKQLENEVFYTSVLDIVVDGKHESVILKDMQRHPAKGFPMHADFLRIEANKVLKVNIPLHFINESTAQGVKVGGGMVQHQATDVEVQCLPKDIPEFIEVDMLNVDLGDIVHLSDLVLPEGVISTALALGDDHDLAIASIIAPRGSKNADDEDEGESEAKPEADAE